MFRIDLTREWKEIKKPLTFMEILEAIKEKDRIVSFCNEKRDISNKGRLDEILSKMGNDYYGGSVAELLLNSKWYIED